MLHRLSQRSRDPRHPTAADRRLARAVAVSLFAVGAALLITVVGVRMSGVSAQMSDDNIPNAVAYSWGVQQTGELDFRSDTDDVYRVDLKKGMLMSAQLTGSAGTDFDMYLFSPDAVNILEDTEVAASEKLGTSGELIRYAAAKDGTYYLDIASWDTSGTYTLVMKVRPNLSLARSRSIYDYNSRVTASLSGAMDPPRPNVRLTIESRPASGGSYSSVGHAEIGADGKYSFAVKPYQTATYRARWAGDSAYLSAVSPPTEIQVKPKVVDWATSTLDLHSADSTAEPNSATLSGSLRTSTQLPSGLVVYIETRGSSASKWSHLAAAKTKSKGVFSYVFSSGQVDKTFYVRARFPGETRWVGVTSAVRTIRMLGD